MSAPSSAKTPHDTDAAEAVPIRRAASLVLLCPSAQSMRVFMGRRSPDAVFMPSRLVFPGGRVEASDAAPHDRLPEPHHWLGADYARMSALLGPEDAAALPRTAWRETLEETGLQAPATNWRLIYRAITPPHRVRRFDTWFFLAVADEALPPLQPGDGELCEIGWRDAHAAMDDNLHAITQSVLRLALDFAQSERPPAPKFSRFENGAIRVTPLWEVV